MGNNSNNNNIYNIFNDQKMKQNLKILYYNNSNNNLYKKQINKK